MYLFFQTEAGIRDSVASRGFGDVYKRQLLLWGGTLFMVLVANLLTFLTWGYRLPAIIPLAIFAGIGFVVEIPKVNNFKTEDLRAN